MNNKYEKILSIIDSSINEVNKQQPPEYKLKAEKCEFLISEKKFNTVRYPLIHCTVAALMMLCALLFDIYNFCFIFNPLSTCF